MPARTRWLGWAWILVVATACGGKSTDSPQSTTLGEDCDPGDTSYTDDDGDGFGDLSDPHDELGFSGAGLGDTNEDGFADVVAVGVSSVRSAGDGAGAVYVVSGSVLGTADVADTALVTYIGSTADEGLGSAVTNLGDTTDRGLPTLVVGAEAGSSAFVFEPAF